VRRATSSAEREAEATAVREAAPRFDDSAAMRAALRDDSEAGPGERQLARRCAGTPS
jgi:hypothetical protein